MARMDPVPGGRMASNWATPNMPRLEMVNVPVCDNIMIAIFRLSAHKREE